MVDLGKAGRQLSAVGARTGDDDKRLVRLDIFIGPVPGVADDEVDVGRIAAGVAVRVDPDAPALELAPEDFGRGLVVEAGDDDAADGQAVFGEVVDKLQGVDVVGDAEIRPDLFPLDVAGIDAQEDVRPVTELLEQAHLDIGIEPGQNPGGVHVKENLAAEFQIQLVFEAADSIENRRFLFGQVFFVVESDREGHEETPRPRRPGNGPSRPMSFIDFVGAAVKRRNRPPWEAALGRSLRRAENVLDVPGRRRARRDVWVVREARFRFFGGASSRPTRWLAASRSGRSIYFVPPAWPGSDGNTAPAASAFPMFHSPRA